MGYLRLVAFVLLPVAMMAMAGCGSSNGAASDPFATSTTGTTSTSTDPRAGTIFGNISTATGKTGLILTADRPDVDVDNGQVLVTATVLDSGAPVGGVPVTFSIAAPLYGPATIESGLTTVRTDSNGIAMTRITTGNTPSTTNVLVAASVKIGSQTAVANTSFQIVRGGGVIMFTDKAGLPPGGQSNILSSITKEVDPTSVGDWHFLQLLPFKVTDSNHNPRVGVPVTISVYSITSLTPSDITIDFLVPPITEPNPQTITSDSAGQGIFNMATAILYPLPGYTSTYNVVLKAVTNDVPPIIAYVGAMYSLTTKLNSDIVIPPLLISPATANFGNSTTVQFTISGGVTPYNVTATNPDRASTTLQPDGHTVVVTLLDSSQWSGTVSFSVTDKNGTGAAVTPLISR